MAKSAGVKLKQGLWTMGQYDIVIIAEGEDDAVAAWLYKVASLGNVRTTTLRAFTEDEMKKIVARMP
jgi:uncharacterized protein with GYD domain